MRSTINEIYLYITTHEENFLKRVLYGKYPHSNLYSKGRVRWTCQLKNGREENFAKPYNSRKGVNPCALSPPKKNGKRRDSRNLCKHRNGKREKFAEPYGHMRICHREKWQKGKVRRTPLRFMQGSDMREVITRGTRSIQGKMLKVYGEVESTNSAKCQRGKKFQKPNVCSPPAPHTCMFAHLSVSKTVPAG